MRPDRGRQVDLVHGRDVEVDEAAIDAEGRIERRTLCCREGVLDQLGRNRGRKAGDVGLDHQRLAGRAAGGAGGQRGTGHRVDRDRRDHVALPVDAVIVGGVGRVLAIEDVDPHRVPPVDELVVHLAQVAGGGRQQLGVERYRQRDGSLRRHAAIAVDVDLVELRGVEDLRVDVGHVELRLHPEIAHVLAVDDRRLDHRIQRVAARIIVERDGLGRHRLRARHACTAKENQQRYRQVAEPRHVRFPACLMVRPPYRDSDGARNLAVSRHHRPDRDRYKWRGQQ